MIYTMCSMVYINLWMQSNSNKINFDSNNNNTLIAAIVLPPSTMHPQLWAELLTRCTIA